MNAITVQPAGYWGRSGIILSPKTLKVDYKNIDSHKAGPGNKFRIQTYL
ncbi:MAG: hypothetical protein HQ564_10390 [Candidatus Saganbacteria bacterium]|nr:hypothetical protein [Candidatus Saganbacteria bacterium]